MLGNAPIEHNCVERFPQGERRRVEGAQAVYGVVKNEPVVRVSKKGFSFFFN